MEDIEDLVNSSKMGYYANWEVAKTGVDANRGKWLKTLGYSVNLGVANRGIGM